MRKRFFSAALALCLCISSQSVAYAGQADPQQQEDKFTEEAISVLVARDSAVPSPAEAYASMIALKDQDAYKEGTAWTNSEPYSDSAGYYHWKGGTIDGKNISAVGCVAFAFILSDAAFGSLPARMYAAGEFTYADIKPGDILRVSNDAHTVIVLEVSDAGVVVAEGNISTGDHKGKVHWGRAISKAEVMSNTSHYITRYPEGYIPPDDPEADVSDAQGTLDGGLAWNLTKAGTLTVSGTGAMPDFVSAGEQPWNGYSSQIRKVIIGDGVTAIGACAFRDCDVLSAEISSDVAIIGNSAFYGSSIISATIPSGVKTIGDNAFRKCENLSSVTVSEGVEIIGQYAFHACTGLTSIVLPSSIEEVGTAAFFQCTAMTDAKFAPGSKQVKLGDNIFTQCYYLAGVTLPKNADCIGEGMFQNCLMLSKVEIPQGVKSIGASAFASCSRLTTVTIPDSVTEIGIAAFASSALADIYFTGTEAQWCSISKMGDTQTAVSKVAVHYNYTPADSPDTDDGNGSGDGSGSGGNAGSGDNTGSGGSTGSGSNTGSGDNTGSGSNTGSTGNAGSSGSAGSGDSTGSGGNTGSTGNAGSGGNTGGTGNAGSGGSAGTGDNAGSTGSTGTGENQAPEQPPLTKGETFIIGKDTYKVTKAGKEVELTASKSTAAKVVINTVTGTDGVKYKVTSIGAKAMQGNNKMVSLTIGDNVKTIRANAFSGCAKLAVVTIGETSKSGLTTIGKSAFNGCRKLGKVTIKSTKLGSVGKQAFKGTKSSLKVKVPSGQLIRYKKILKKAGLKSGQIY